MDFDPEEPVEYPISNEIDLHTFSPQETRSAVTEYLYECRKQGIYTVRIIHGKGKGVQKNIIKSLLKEHPLVASFYDAQPASGGWGATIAELKRE